MFTVPGLFESGKNPTASQWLVMVTLSIVMLSISLPQRYMPSLVPSMYTFLMVGSQTKSSSTPHGITKSSGLGGWAKILKSAVTELLATFIIGLINSELRIWVLYFPEPYMETEPIPPSERSI